MPWTRTHSDFVVMTTGFIVSAQVVNTIGLILSISC